MLLFLLFLFLLLSCLVTVQCLCGCTCICAFLDTSAHACITSICAITVCSDQLLAFSVCPGSARAKLELLHVSRIITVVMYLPVSAVQELFLVQPLKDCHLMDRLNRMGAMHLKLMRMTHREWVGVMTRIPAALRDGGRKHRGK